MRTGLWVCLLGSWLILMGASQKPPPMLRFHAQASPKFGKENVIPVTLIDPRATIFIGKTPDLSEKDIRTLEILDRGRVLVIFNEEGARKLEEITRANLETILVVICNGRVVYAPIIDIVIRNGRFIIPQGVTAQDVNELSQVTEDKKMSMDKEPAEEFQRRPSSRPTFYTKGVLQ